MLITRGEGEFLGTVQRRSTTQRAPSESDLERPVGMVNHGSGEFLGSWTRRLNPAAGGPAQFFGTRNISQHGMI